MVTEFPFRVEVEPGIQFEGAESRFGDTGDQLNPVVPPIEVMYEEKMKKIVDISDMGGTGSSSDGGDDITPQTPQQSPKPNNNCGDSGGTHDWEEMAKPGYTILGGRFCGGCAIPFMNLPKLTGVRGYWPSTTNIVYHCRQCDLTLCKPCKVEKDLGSPKKNKRRRHD
jgi:hypothetical protein